MKSITAFIAGLALLLAVSSCTLFAPAPKLFVLMPETVQPAKPLAVDEAHPVKLEKVWLPSYLSSPEFRLLNATGELKTLSGGLWAMNLDALLQDTLEQTLRQSLGAARLSDAAVPTARRLTIRCDQLSANADGVFLASGEVLCLQGKTLTRQPFAFSLKLAKPMTPARLRQGYQLALSRLVEQIYLLLAHPPKS